MVHRRVELRNHLSGTGSLNTPERLDELEKQKQHSELNARLPPKTRFSAVMQSKAQPVNVPNKRSRPLSKQKFGPSSGHAAVGFGASSDIEDDYLSDTPPAHSKVIFKG